MKAVRFFILLLAFASASGHLRIHSQTLDSFNPGANGGISSLVIDRDQILVAGNFTILGGQRRPLIGRLNPDGTLDTNFSPAVSADNVFPIAVQEDGKVLVGGRSTPGGEDATYLARFNGDGTPDTNFLQNIYSYDGDLFSLGLQEDGKILMGGAFYPGIC